MARRSLQSWAGVAHTETLSLLVLGLVLTSAGRYAEAEEALGRALQMAREQASPGFEAEALVRLARLRLQSGRPDAAQAVLDVATPLLAQSPEPLRVSQLVLAQAQAAVANGRPWPADAQARLESVAAGSAHPLVHVRLAWVLHLKASLAADPTAAERWVAQMADTARRAGLLEPLAEALLLRAQAHADLAAAGAWRAEAASLASRQGFAGLALRLGAPRE
jgi:ATP/maltotriose-dependent transcriptional regulator MalT